MLKKIQSISRNVIFTVCIYTIVSLFLLGNYNNRKSETSLYTMNVPWIAVSENIGETAEYRQEFYAPGRCSGIQLCTTTDGTEAQRDLVVRVYDITDVPEGELLGEQVVECDRIVDNGYIDIMFEDYTLKEGRKYYFEACTVGEGTNPTRFWLGNEASGYCLGASYQCNPLESTYIVFNLIYDYADKNFVIWMFVSVLFLLVILKMEEVRKGDREGLGENG